MYFSIKQIKLSLIYNLGIYLAHFVIKCVAPFNKKIKQGALGRSNTFTILKRNLSPQDKTIWFHCASLGEYEQGLPVFEKLRAHYKNHKIVLSFFSPSGYEIRKNTPIADIVTYLPLDSKKNASKFIEIINPELTVFVKYDIWPNYLNVLKKKHLKTILISATFRPNQIYFKSYGKIFKNALHAFNHIFTQNENSKTLLNAIDYNHVSITGDTRFDRVSNQLKSDNTLEFIAEFKNEQLCVVIGSSWPEDESLFIEFINANRYPNVKYIFAPHNIKPHQIKNLVSKLNKKTILYSEKKDKTLNNFDVLIINTIGLLSKIYNYADIAYVGGAMGNTGLHNTLEPAVFGIPIIIGKYHKKFPEAQLLINHGGLFSVSNQIEFNKILSYLIDNSDFRVTSGSKNRMLIKKNRGAVIQILNYLRI